MKTAHATKPTAQQTAHRRWPAIHGKDTYSFVPAPPELSMLRTHISTLEERLQQQAALIDRPAQPPRYGRRTGEID